ncbi:FeoA family protein [Curtanaerobium respiraculi]|uniref:FeoA family protein n=1 Tax=Curtanaerobium respiraculi TaxID=2949669 RepID=UPI0024B386DA|nr:ferrous iron transport protein A [Curtanaerobium respiraculi]
MNLSEAKPGTEACIAHIDGDIRLLTRFASMGMSPGASVKIVRNDRRRPVLLFGRDTLLAISRKDASLVEVAQ